MSNRNLLVLLLIALHPVWNLARMIGGNFLPLPTGMGLGITLPLVEVAWVVQLFLSAGLMTWMTGSANAQPHPPASLNNTVSGFQFRLGTGPDPLDAIKHLGLAALASTWGMALLLGVAVYARPGDYPPIPAWLFVVISSIAHLALQTTVLGAATFVRTTLARRHEVDLDGRMLRVGSRSLTLTGHHQITVDGALRVKQGSEELTIEGPSPVLSWLATELEKIQPDGAEGDVPEALRSGRKHAQGLPGPS